VAPLCFSVTHKPKVTSGTEGKFSIQFCTALAVSRGKVGNKEFVDEAVNDRYIQDVMQKVAVRSNPTLKETEANIVVHTSDGLRHERQVSVPRGDPKNPLTFDDILRKFKEINKEAFSEKRIEEIAGTIENLEKLKNTARLIDLCFPEYRDSVKGSAT
jgi:2-methylcitrate dehydratase PrpD